MSATPFVLGPLPSLEHTPTQAEFELFARISGDDNPIHVDPAFSARTRFGRTVAHGMMLYSLVWGHLRRVLGPVEEKSQSLMFPAPSFAGEPLRIEATITAIENGVAVVDVTVVRIADGSIGCRSTTRLVAGEGAR